MCVIEGCFSFYIITIICFLYSHELLELCKMEHFFCVWMGCDGMCVECVCEREEGVGVEVCRW